MPSTFTLTLDTVGPTLTGLEITRSGTDYVLTATPNDASHFEIKLWGPGLGIANEGDAQWVAYNVAGHVLNFTAGDGVKTIYARTRDDVLNESASQTANVTVDRTGPTLNITAGPSRTKVSLKAGANTTIFTFSASEALDGWEVRVVPDALSQRNVGTVLASSEVDVAANAPVQATVNASDLQAAVGADGVYVIKVFGRDAGGNWSS